jgi:hypothetical protein
MFNCTVATPSGDGTGRGRTGHKKRTVGIRALGMRATGVARPVERGVHVIDSWLESGRAATLSLAGALVLGASGPAAADHERRIEIEVSTPGIYTRFSTGPRYYQRYYGHGGYYGWAPPPVPVYVPGYWTWQAPRTYWRDDCRHYYDHPRRHGHRKHRGRGHERHDH